MKKTALHLLLSFSKTSEKLIKETYEIPSEEELLAVFWLTDDIINPKDKIGLVFTRKRILWNLPDLQSGAAIKESFNYKSIKLSLPEDTNSKNYEVQLESNDKTFTLIFDSSINKDNLEILVQFINSYFENSLDLNMYSKNDESFSFTFSIQEITDYLNTKKKILKQKLFSRKKATAETDSFKTKTEESSKPINKNAEKEQTVQNTQIKNCKDESRLKSFFRHTADLCADLLLAVGILIFGKYNLMKKLDLNPQLNLFIKTNIITFCIILLAVFAIIKIFVILTNKKCRKVPAFIILVMILINSALIVEKFSIFIILLTLLLLTFQFTENASSRVIKLKCLLFVLICLTGYFSVHYILYPDFREIVKSLYDQLGLDFTWW